MELRSIVSYLTDLKYCYPKLSFVFQYLIYRYKGEKLIDLPNQTQITTEIGLIREELLAITAELSKLKNSIR